LEKFKPTYSNLTSLSFILFTIHFLSAGFYQLPFIEFGLETALIVKRSFFLFCLSLMVLLINWRILLTKKTIYLIIIWTTIFGTNFLFHDNLDLIILRALQSASVFILVSYLMQNFDGFLRFVTCRSLQVSLMLFSFLSLIIVIVSYTSSEVAVSVLSGFGGGSVNFSIWISQVSVLILTLWYLDKLPTFRYLGSLNFHLFFYLAPVFALQINTGGRLGVLVTLSSLFAALFFKFKSEKKFEKIIFPIFTIILFGGLASTILSTLIYDNYSIFDHGIFRHMNSLELGKSENFSNWAALYDFLDQLTSHRLYLFTEGLKALDWKIALVGKGFDNFTLVGRFGHVQHVHNVFLKTLGELGILGLIFLCSVIFFPILKLPKFENSLAVKFGLSVWLIPAIFQPEFYFSQIGSSLVFWVVFAYSLTRIFPEKKLR